MTTARPVHTRARQVAAVVAILFGIASIGAGGTVLAGRDPGYLVHRPLVLFNTLMGFVYVGAGILAWRRARSDRLVAGGIVIANLVVLAWIVVTYRSGGAAFDSVSAMVLRSGVWLLLLLVLSWTSSASRRTA